MILVIVGSVIAYVMNYKVIRQIGTGIFKKVKEDPEVAGDLRKFMSYYLPTTEKLLQSYVDLRKENLSVENITNSQREIEDATDVINDAFVQLLNQLFQDAAWDISSDISVMKTMMKQDSLI